MDFKFSPEDDTFRQDLRGFVRAELPSNWESLDRSPGGHDWDLTRQMRKKLADRGWLTMHWPEAYGGQAASPVRSTIYN
ncbi:MAG: acyl-CoA dehydrogenase family protein, partial [Dehalococcoidia bacterium]|nr:acyl-CoA dehydrogenase family protein [Dehalococcoidia bacterium]